MSVRISYWLARLLPGLLCAILVHHIWRYRYLSGNQSTILEGLSRQLYPSATRNYPTPNEVIVSDVLFQPARSLGTTRAAPVRGAETLAMSPTGAIFTGTADGDLVELLPHALETEGTVDWSSRSLESFDRVLGIKSVSVVEQNEQILETLLVCDANLGLYEVEVTRPLENTLRPSTVTRAQLLLNQVDGKKVTVCNSLDFIPKGSEIYVFFTDSAEVPLAQLGAEIFAEHGSGRVIVFKYGSYKAQSEKPPEAFAHSILNQVRFSNGIVVQPSAKHNDHFRVIVAETMGRALLEIDYDTVSDRLISARASWAGAFHVDNLQLMRPRLAIGAEKLSFQPIKAHGLQDLPANLLLVGIPHCTAAWQERLLYSSKRFRRFLSSWLPLPIRIALGNPILFSNSAIGVFDVDQSVFIKVLRASPKSSSNLKFTSEGSPWWSKALPDGSHNVTILLGSFANSEPVKTASFPISAR